MKELAERLAAAYLSHQLGERFETSLKKIKGSPGGIGEGWIFWARMISKHMTEAITLNTEEPI